MINSLLRYKYFLYFICLYSTISVSVTRPHKGIYALMHIFSGNSVQYEKLINPDDKSSSSIHIIIDLSSSMKKNLDLCLDPILEKFATTSIESNTDIDLSGFNDTSFNIYRPARIRELVNEYSSNIDYSRLKLLNELKNRIKSPRPNNSNIIQGVNDRYNEHCERKKYDKKILLVLTDGVSTDEESIKLSPQLLKDYEEGKVDMKFCIASKNRYIKTNLVKQRGVPAECITYMRGDSREEIFGSFGGELRSLDTSNTRPETEPQQRHNERSNSDIKFPAKTNSLNDALFH